MSDSVKVTFNIRKLYSLLLVIFVVIPDVSSYFSKNGLATIGFIILSGILFLIGIKRNLVHIHFNFISKCVVAYIVLLTMSTLLNLRLVSGIPNQGMTGIFCDVSYLFIAYALTSVADEDDFITYLRDFIVILAIISLFGFLIGKRLFSFLKAGTLFDVDDGGSLSAIFEYRHFYGVFLIFAAVSLLFKPYKNSFFNYFSFIVLTANIILTLTRNIWIAFVVVIIIYAITNFRIKIKKRHVVNLLIGISVLLLFCICLWPWLSTMYSKFSMRISEVFDQQNKYGGISGVRGYVTYYGTKYIFDNWRKYLLIGGGQGLAIKWLVDHPYGQWHEWSNAIDVQYVSTFMNSGLIGFILLFAVIVKTIKEFIKGNSKIISLALIGLFIAILFFDVISMPISVFALMNVLLCFLDKSVATTKKKSI